VIFVTVVPVKPRDLLAGSGVQPGGCDVLASRPLSATGLQVTASTGDRFAATTNARIQVIAPRSTGQPPYNTATPTDRHDPILSAWTPSIPDEQSPTSGDQHCNREATVGHGADLWGGTADDEVMELMNRVWTGRVAGREIAALLHGFSGSLRGGIRSRQSPLLEH
jgi:hypothetical protein